MNHFLHKQLRIVLFWVAICVFIPAQAQVVSKTYSDSWGKQGFNLSSTKSNGIEVIYSVNEFSVNEVVEKGINWHSVSTPGIFLFADAGKPELPSSGRYIAIPKGAKAQLRVLDSRYETFKGIDIMPSAAIPFDTQDETADRQKDLSIYEKDAFFPTEAATISEVTQIRGIDVVMLGISPFQYNPVTRELKVLRDIKVELTYDQGKGYYAEEKYRSPWWDQILDDVVLNFPQLPKPDYSSRFENIKDATGFEYLIIVPDNADFIAWADTIKKFRTQQGIYTGIKTITEVGGNTVNAITNYVANAYNNWDIPPVAVLLMADYSAPGTTTGITSPSFSHPYEGTYITDNRYADVTEDLLPEIAFARITANNAAQLQVMVKKFIDYENNPPTNPSFYNSPITALGWQTERWFQICSEVVGGFWKNELGKNPVRINAVYQGTPGSSWSSATNTAAVVNYFGPSGRNYIPATPAELGGWTGGTPAMINTAINNGSFMLQHRDHGYEQGWGEPDYSSTSISGLTNTDLSFIMSINCLTGRFDYNSEVFTEKFHRYTYNGQASGALGLIAASQVSYSFVNDVYVWGLMDNMWPTFMNDYGNHTINRKLLPAFGNIAGKFFLQQSSWPYNTDSKAITYDLFHHHGDAFLRVYSEVPQALTVSSPDVIVFGQNSISVTADDEALVALTWFNTATNETRIVSVAESEGTALNMVFAELAPVGSKVLLTVTKQNCFRYTKEILVIPPDGAYVIRSAHSIDDAIGNGNGTAEFGESFNINLSLQNVGNANATNVVATITTTDPYVISLTQAGNVPFGTIEPDQIVVSSQKFLVEMAENTPNQHLVNFDLTIQDGSKAVYNSTLNFRVNAPVFTVSEILVNDSEGGDNNGRLDPGETAQLIFKTKNTGNALANAPEAWFDANSPYLSIEADNITATQIAAGETVDVAFTVTAHPSTIEGTYVESTYSIEQGFSFETAYTLIIGQEPQINIGSGATAATYYPFYNWYKANRSQMLYLESELGEGDKIITKLGFDLSYITPTAAHRNLTNFKIIVKPTTATTLTGAFTNTADGTIVFQSASYAMPETTGWHNWDIEDFVLPAGNNLIVEVIWGILPSYCGSGQSFKVNGTQAANNRVVYGYDDNDASPSYDGSSNVLPNLHVEFAVQAGGEQHTVTFKAVNGGVAYPVANASINLGSAQYLTNENGEVSVDLISGSYTLSANAEGMIPVESLAFEVVDQDITVIVDFTPPPTFNVVFNVSDASNAPVTNAQITFNNQTYANGVYTITGIQAGSYNYLVSHPDYVSAQGSAVVVDNDIQVNATLVEGFTADFMITDGTYALSNTKVSINGQDIFSNAAGIASLKLLPGTYPYTVQKEGYHTQEGSLIINNSAITTNITLSLITYTASFTVTDGTEAIQGATISVNNQSLASNAQGQAQIALVPGTYSYSVSKTAYQNYNSEFQITNQDVSIDINMSLITYQVSFNVISDGSPLAGASIQVNNQTIVSNQQGVAQISLVPGTYPFTVSKANYDPYSSEVVVSNQAVNLNIDMSLTVFPVTILVKCEGEAIEGANVSINNQTLVSNNEGAVEISLIPGNYDFTVNKSGYDEYEGDVTVTNQAETVTANITAIIPVFNVTFVVTNAAGQAINDAVLTFDSQAMNAGDYIISGVEAGTYSYQLTHPQYFTSEGSVEVTNEDVNVPVTLILNNIGIDALDLSAVKAFPNPTSGKITVELGDSHSWQEVQLINALGQKIQTILMKDNNNASELEFDLSNAPDGIYMLKLRSGDKTATIKIVKH